MYLFMSCCNSNLKEHRRSRLSIITMKALNRLYPYASALVLCILFSLPVHAVDTDPEPQQERAADGELLFPENYDAGKQKKCMTVCKNWGEDCILLQKGNPRSGYAMDRKCRRVCKSFAEECF